jgi:hypothetical protein
MPYGIRTTLFERHDLMRRGAKCWLQSLEGGEDERQIQLLGLSPARKMISFWGPLSHFTHYERHWFVLDNHPRLAFANKVDAQACADALAYRAAQATTGWRLQA